MMGCENDFKYGWLRHSLFQHLIHANHFHQHFLMYEEVMARSRLQTPRKSFFK